jgi:hypothetical protein
MFSILLADPLNSFLGLSSISPRPRPSKVSISRPYRFLGIGLEVYSLVLELLLNLSLILRGIIGVDPPSSGPYFDLLADLYSGVDPPI